MELTEYTNDSYDPQAYYGHSQVEGKCWYCELCGEDVPYEKSEWADCDNDLYDGTQDTNFSFQ